MGLDSQALAILSIHYRTAFHSGDSGRAVGPACGENFTCGMVVRRAERGEYRV